MDNFTVSSSNVVRYQSIFCQELAYFFIWSGQYYRLMTKFESQLIDILPGIFTFFILLYSIFQYNVQICLKFFDFFARIGRYFGWKWAILQFKVQGLSSINRIFDKYWHIFFSIFQYNVQIYLKLFKFFAGIGWYFG